MTHPDRNQLIDYAAGTLSEGEACGLERHFAGCPSCARQVSAFRDAGERFDELWEGLTAKGTAALVGDLNRTGKREPRAGRFRLFLWPERPLVLRPVFVAILAVLLLVPVLTLLYRSDAGGPPAVPAPGAEQRITLLPLRDTELPSFKRRPGDVGIVHFVFRGAAPGTAFELALTGPDGQVVFSEKAFDRFDEKGSGEIRLELEQLAVGRYRLTIRDPDLPPPVDRQSYTFLIEPSSR